MKMAVIADPDTVLAFRLAGVEGRAAHHATALAAQIERLRGEAVGLILIGAAMAEENRELIEKIMLEPGSPLILEIPEFQGPMPRKSRTTDWIAALLGR